MRKFTPGPWYAPSAGIYAGPFGNNRARGPMIANTGTSECVRGLRKSCEKRGTDEMIESCANARLIAAAPELYEACATLLRAWDKGEDTNDIEWEDLTVAVDLARAALRKVEGEI